jgi:ABC-type multidrug transport system fused ATPase/permease subunit
MQTFKKLLFLITPYEKKRAGLLLIMILIMALLEMIGVASILPFVTILTNPDLLETNFILNKIFQTSSAFGIENTQQFIFSFGILVFILLIISVSFKVLTIYTQVLFTEMCQYNISKRLIEDYLYQPYSWFLSRHSADFGKTILSEVNAIVANGITPILDLISKGMIIIALVTLLVITDPKLALTVGLVLPAIYGFIFSIVRKYLKNFGEESLKNNQLRFMTVSEAFGAIKEIKVGGLEENYIKIFSNSAHIFARTQTFARVISQFPRFIIEIVFFGGILLMMFYIMSQKGSLNSALPIISLYVFAGYRLMPAMQQVYGSFTQLTFVGPSLNKLYDDLKNLKPFNKILDQQILTINEKITLKNIYYHYPNSSKIILRDINLSIPSKSTVGFVGATGSGKTTIVDIILGLLQPQKGTLEVDKKVITKKNVRSWQRLVGYAPQHIYLSDDTVAANIVFGTEPKDINQDMVKKVAKIANLHKFVMDELPRQYETTIGERGVRLSGGQRQRIGIARALYHNPKVLILDEATSALDTQTEQAVMDAINNLKKKITIILIAHRLSTVKNCDIIYLIDKGQIKDQGTFKELRNINQQFRKNTKNI